MLTIIKQKEKYKYCMISLICEIFSYKSLKSLKQSIKWFPGGGRLGSWGDLYFKAHKVIIDRRSEMYKLITRKESEQM